MDECYIVSNLDGGGIAITCIESTTRGDLYTTLVRDVEGKERKVHHFSGVKEALFYHANLKIKDNKSHY